MENEPVEFFQELKVMITDYLDARIKLLKYEIYEKTAKISSSLFSAFVIVMLAFLVLFFLSIALGFYFGTLFNSYGTGFILVTVLYLILLIPFLLFRKNWIERIIINRIIEQLTEKEEDGI